LLGCSSFCQAVDGIRGDLVTGVQTCALPISIDDGLDAAQTEQGDESVDDAEQKAQLVRVSLAFVAKPQRERTGGQVQHILQRTEDRKSTRLNSSHQIISYAVFCLKKKKQQDA